MGIFIGGPLDGHIVDDGLEKFKDLEHVESTTWKEHKVFRYLRHYYQVTNPGKCGRTTEVFFVLFDMPLAEAGERAELYLRS